MFGFLKKRAVDPKRELRKLLGDYSLPTFPSVIMEILTKIRERDTSASKIADLIALDPNLTVQVLRTANSAGFSSRRRIDSLNQAVGIMGLTHLESLVLSIAAGGSLPKRAKRGYEFRRFWNAACRRAVTARELARILCPTKDAECFSAGFLQDLAIPFLVHNQEESYGPILEAWHSGEGASLADLERATYGWDHAEVATFILSEWELPESLASAIGGHHNGHSDLYDTPAPVSLVGYLGETEENLGADRLIEEASSKYGIPREKVESLLADCFEQAEEFARMMN